MRLKLLLLSLLFILLTFVTPFAFAQTSDHQPVILQKTQTVNHNYFGTGSSVDVEGTVNGDAYLAGGTILINGTINGDLLSAGGQTTINGTVHNIRSVGGQIIIDGNVTGNVTVAGGSITITNGAHIAGSIVGVGGQVLLSGPIGKTVNFGAGQVTLENTVGGDMSVITGQLTLNPDAKVNGSLWYQSPQDAQIENGSTIIGKITHAYPPQKQFHVAPIAFLAGLSIFASIAIFLIELVIGLLLIAFLPIYSTRVVTYVADHLWLSLGIGILAWIVTPFAFFLLSLTLIGIPLAILLIIFVAILSYIGRIFAALFFGNWLVQLTNQKKVNVFVAFIVGLIAVEIISLVPFLGGLFIAIISAIGFGAVLILEKVYYVELRAKKII